MKNWIGLPYSNYSKIRDHIIANERFSGNTMWADKDSDGTYRIFSYNTLIYEESPDGTAWFNDHRYSSTTSHHQDIIRGVKYRQIGDCLRCPWRPNQSVDCVEFGGQCAAKKM